MKEAAVADLRSRLDQLLKAGFPEVADGLLAGASFQAAGVDSLRLVGFLLDVQREFDVDIDGDEVEVEGNLGSVVEMLVSKGA
jgi:acyl carrier protein